MTITMPDADQRMERSGHTLTVLRRVDGKWLLARDANLVFQVGKQA